MGGNIKVTYFDYAATTPMSDEAYEVYNEINKKFFMNTQSNSKSSDLLKKSQNKILEILGLNNSEYEIIFTSGGTESNNLGILGKYKNMEEKKHFITTAIEHPSVLATFKELERLGHEVEYIKPQKNGIISPQDVISKIKKNTSLIAIMGVNNELGTIQPINELFLEIKNSHPQILLFSDLVQAIGKMKINYQNIDMFSISSHKIYGPKDVGILVKRKNIVLEPILYGSKTSLRPGTQSLGAQIAFTNALRKVIMNEDENIKQMDITRNYIQKQLEKLDNVIINGDSKTNIINFSLNTKAQAETIVEYLISKDIYLSTKSSCAQKLNEPSHVLKALDMDNTIIDRTLRISFGTMTTEAEIDKLMNELSSIIKKF